MRARIAPGDRELAALARRQHGVVSHCQLEGLGFGGKAIQYRVSIGRLHRVHEGVYAVGHRRLTGHGRWMAAVLSCGPGAVLSHQSAAALWDIRRTSSPLVHVTVPVRSGRRRPGIVIHRVRGLHPDDVTVHEGIPVTSVARALLDCAENLRPRELERAFEESERRRVLDVRAVETLMKRSPGRRGLRPLGALLKQQNGPPPVTRSELERLFLDFCADAGLPRPTVNATVEGHEVDMVWTKKKLIVELDSRAYHRTRAAFERDRRRDAKLQMAGFRVIRVTYRWLTEDPTRLAQTLRALLDA